MNDRRKVYVDSSWGTYASGNVVFSEDNIYSNRLQYSSIPRNSTISVNVRKTNREQVDHFVANIAKTCAELSRKSYGMCTDHSCPVCLSGNADIMATNCRHTFHGRCFMKWFRMNKTCPTCRTLVTGLQAVPLTLQSVLTTEEITGLISYSALFADLEKEPSIGDLLDHDMECENFDSTNSSFCNSLLTSSNENPLSGNDMLFSMDKTAFSSNNNNVGQEDVDMDKIDNNTNTSTVEIFLEDNLEQKYYAATSFPDYWDLMQNGFIGGAHYGEPVPKQSPPISMLSTMNPASSSTTSLSLSAASSASSASSASNSSSSFSPSTTTTPTTSSFGLDADMELNKNENSNDSDNKKEDLLPTRIFSCRCLGDCSNARCSCVKDGSVCGASCKCTNCNNPFLTLGKAGYNLKYLHSDPCFMHNLAKLKDIRAVMDRLIDIECCKSKTQVKNVIYGYTCSNCAKKYILSWCSMKLCDQDKHRRNHCESCRRCTDYRDVHCNECGHCYFAGISSSFQCPCIERRKIISKNRSAVEVPVQDVEDGCILM